MVIDGRTLNLNSTPFSSKTPFAERSEKETAALKQLMSEGNTNGKILIDIQPPNTNTNANIDGFQNNSITVNASGTLVGGIPMKKIYMQFELDYTAEDALKNNWAASTGNTRGTVFGGNETVKSEDVIGMNQEEFLSYVRENGLDKEINWSRVSYNFMGSSDHTNFTEYTDYAGALYASVYNRIMNDFEGDEQAEQLNMLNQMYDYAIETNAQFYIGAISDTYKQFGIELPEDELTQSIRDVMMAKKDDYINYIESNKDYANLADSEDKWLERDVTYMANALRNAFSPDEITETSGFSENDIKMVSMIAGIYSGYANNVKAGYGINTQFNDEESVGLALAMQYLTQATVMDTFGGSDKVKSLADDMFNKYRDIVIDSVNKTLQAQQKNMPSDPSGKFSAGMFPQLNQDDVYAILNKMINTYEETGDAEKSILETTSFAYNQFRKNESKAENASVFRYSGAYDSTEKKYFVSSKNFWNDFYDSNNNSSYMSKLISKWNMFAYSIESKDLKAVTTPGFNHYRSWTQLEKPLVGGYSAEAGAWGDKLN